MGYCRIGVGDGDSKLALSVEYLEAVVDGVIVGRVGVSDVDVRYAGIEKLFIQIN